MSAAEEALQPSFSAEEQKRLAGTLVTFLSQYTHLSDSYVIEFFTEDLWSTLPPRWRPPLQDLTCPQVADLLLDEARDDRRYPSVWPLSLLAFRSTAHALAFPRRRRRRHDDGSAKPQEFAGNESQSSLLAHVFRKHVKPKKQHEIRRLGTLVQQLCERTACGRVVDVGSGQGHLTRFMSFGLGLSVTAVEADRELVATATRFDEQLLRALEKDERRRSSSGRSPPPPPRSSPRHVHGWVDPTASWEAFVTQLRAADGESRCDSEHEERPRVVGTPPPDGPDAPDSDTRGLAAAPPPPGFVLTGLHACGDLSSTLLRHFVHCPHVRAITSVACCYMKLSTRESPAPPGLVEPPSSRPPHDSAPPRFGYPMSRVVAALPGHGLSYKAREGACHAMEDYVRRLRGDGGPLRTHCYRAALEVFVRDARPDLRRAAIQTVKKAHLLSFPEYARLGLARVGLPPDLPLDPRRVAAMLEQQGRVVVFFSLNLLLAPVVESLVLLDRILYLQERGVQSRLLPLFDPDFSPRNLVLVAVKPGGGEPAAGPAGSGPDPAGSGPDPAGCGPDPAGCGPDPAGCGPDPAGCGPDPAGCSPDPAGCGPDPAGSGPDTQKKTSF